MTQGDLAEDFGRLVRRLRSERGFSQEGFAFRVGIHRTYMGDIERGEKNVTIKTADRIAKALGLPLAGLFADLERDPDGTDGR